MQLVCTLIVTATRFTLLQPPQPQCRGLEAGQRPTEFIETGEQVTKENGPGEPSALWRRIAGEGGRERMSASFMRNSWEAARGSKEEITTRAETRPLVEL